MSAYRSRFQRGLAPVSDVHGVITLLKDAGRRMTFRVPRGLHRTDVVERKPESTAPLVQEFGDLRWRSSFRPHELKSMSRHNCIKPHHLKITGFRGKSRVMLGVKVYGECTPAEFGSLRAAARHIAWSSSSLLSHVHEIHIIKELGEFLTARGSSDQELVAFSLDSRGTLLLSSSACSSIRSCKRVLKDVLHDLKNYHSEQRIASQSQSGMPDTTRRALAASPLFSGPRNGAPFGLFRNRLLIDRDVPICGNIYFDEEGFGITVNPQSQVLEDCYREVLQILQAERDCSELAILQTVSAHVARVFASSQSSAFETLKAAHRIVPGNEVGLDLFVRSQLGVHSQKALLAAYLLTRLKDARKLAPSASLSLERSTFQGRHHAWVRYVNPKGDVTILDPHFEYVGLLDNYAELRNWPYHRPEDLNRERRMRPL